MGILGSNKNKEPRTGIFSDWLETLQQESWQLELLISGFALLGVWQSKVFINKIELYNTLNVSSETLDVSLNLLVYLLNIGWFIFLSNLLIHIILRGFWIGAIGLRYVSGEIDYDELGYSEYFTKYLKKKIGSYDDFIERLERLCSIIFAFTFLLFFLFISLILYFGLFIAMVGLVGKFIDSNNQLLIGLIFMVYFGMGFLMLIDFLSFGGLKKLSPGIAASSFRYIFKFMSFISLSFLYRPLLYNFLDDKYTRRLLLLSIPYFIALIAITPFTSIQSYPYFPKFENDRTQSEYISNSSIHWYYYDDLRKKHIESTSKTFAKKEIINFASLSSFEISEDYATLFLRQLTSDMNRIEKKPTSAAFFKTGLRHGLMGKEAKDSILEDLNHSILLDYKEKIQFKKDNKDLYSEERWTEIMDSVLVENRIKRELHEKKKIEDNLEAFKSIYSVYLNGKDVLETSECKFYIHPNAGEKGILCFLDLQDLDSGLHDLRIAKEQRVRNISHRDSIVRHISFIRNTQNSR